jgi:trehalose 6-phosphate phosphatase
VNVLDLEVDLDAFWQGLRRANRRALLLDYDGTLAPFRVERGEAGPYPGVREALEAIAEDPQTRLVLVSGRRAHEAVSLLALHAPIEAWGAHGWERLMPDGRYEVGQVSEQARIALQRAEAWVGVRGWAGRLERKPGALAFHVRGLPYDVAKDLERQVIRAWDVPAREFGLALVSFDGGVELRAAERDKGYAVETILREQGEGAAAYLGDDQTDEAAFARIRGRGLSVLVRPDWRPTVAQAWLRPPVELIEFLRRWRMATMDVDWSAGAPSSSHDP